MYILADARKGKCKKECKQAKKKKKRINCMDVQGTYILPFFFFACMHAFSRERKRDL